MTKTKKIAECAVLIALAAVLSLIKVWKMPWGGSVTLLSMLPLAVLSIRHGIKWGIFSSFVSACIQLMFGILFDGLLGWGLTMKLLIACMLLDYIIPFTVLGLSGLFAKKGLPGAVAGTALAIALRYICHVLSGVYVFVSVGMLWDGFVTDNPWLYSSVYNGCYMLPEMILTVIGAVIVYQILAKVVKPVRS